MRKPPAAAVVRRQAEELKRAIEKRFPGVDVEYLDWEQLMECRREGVRVSAYELDLFIDVYVWVRGDQETVENAFSLALDLTSEMEERSGVTIEVRTGTDIWCRRSGPEPDDDWDPVVRRQLLYTREDKRGVTFLCWETQAHEHDWGRVKPQPPIQELR